VSVSTLLTDTFQFPVVVWPMIDYQNNNSEGKLRLYSH